MNNNICKIVSVQSYLDAINIYTHKIDFLNARPTLFRGVENSKYTIIPKLLRKTNDGNKIYSNREADILNNFKKRAYSFIKNPPDNSDDINWISMAQHYGVPTRLIDWTENCLIALYFAVENAKFENDGVVWAIDYKRYEEWLVQNDAYFKKLKSKKITVKYIESLTRNQLFLLIKTMMSINIQQYILPTI